jgi:hypothetical protein
MNPKTNRIITVGGPTWNKLSVYDRTELLRSIVTLSVKRYGGGSGKKMVSLYAPTKRDQPCGEILIDNDCFNRRSMLGMEIGRVLGVGYSGKAFAICGVGGCQKVLKMIDLSGDPDLLLNFDREVGLITIADETEMGPKMFDHWTYVNSDSRIFGLILMDRWDATLREAIEMGMTVPRDLLADFVNKLWSLWTDHHIWHLEGHSGDNIFVKIRDGNIMEMCVGDWGDVTIFGDYQEPYIDDLEDDMLPSTKSNMIAHILESTGNLK